MFLRLQLASLRTTLSVLTIGMYKDLLEELGTAFDTLVDSILSPLAKLSGATKKITAENSQNTVGLIIKKTTCPPKTFIPFLSLGAHEKAPQVRGYYARHLKEYIDKHNGNRSPAWSVEHINSVSDMLKHLLGDGTPAVRETARLAFWTFTVRYQSEAESLLNSLDDGARKQLEKVKPAPGVASAVERVEASVPTIPVPAVAKERKPVSNMMAEMKRKKMAAMRALAASRSSNEDMLLPETDSNPTAPSSPARPDYTPPVRVASPAKRATETVPVETSIPLKSSRTSLPRAASSPQIERKPLPRSPARVPLPESPILIDLESRRNRQSSMIVSPPVPAPDPFEDVFTSSVPETGAGVDKIQADLASIRFAPETTRDKPIVGQASELPSSRMTESSMREEPMLPLALTVPDVIQDTTVSTSDTRSARSTTYKEVEPVVPSATQDQTGTGINRPKWDPAAQSYRTPPFSDCTLWLEAVRAEEKRHFNQEDHETTITSYQKTAKTSLVTPEMLSEVFRGLVHVALQRNGSIGSPPGVDGVRQSFDLDASTSRISVGEQVASEMIENAGRQLSRHTVSTA